MKTEIKPIESSQLLGFRIDRQAAANLNASETHLVKTGIKKGNKPPMVGPAATMPTPPAPTSRGD